jgi:hypothetical protein
VSFVRFKHSNVYEHELQCTTIHGAFPLLYLPLLIPLALPFVPLLLTWNPPSCDRICPPQSQVACKLTLFDPALPPHPPPSKFPESQSPCASLRRHQERPDIFCREQSWCSLSGQLIYIHICEKIMLIFWTVVTLMHIYMNHHSRFLFRNVHMWDNQTETTKQLSKQSRQF